MLPLRFDPEVLSSLPVMDEAGAARVRTVLAAIRERRVLPYLATLAGADPVRLARVSERTSVARMEDPGAVLPLVSLTTMDDRSWTVHLHERIFDYVAFGLPLDPAAGLGAGSHEGRKVLALAELILRHELEHALFDHRDEVEVVLSDLRFAEHRRTQDPAFLETLLEVLRDETNGLRGADYLELIGGALDTPEVLARVKAMVAAHAVILAELPTELQCGMSRVASTDLVLAVLGTCVAGSRDGGRSVAARSRMLDRVRAVLGDLAEHDPVRLRTVFQGLGARWGSLPLLRELEVAPLPPPEAGLEVQVARLAEHLERTRPKVPASLRPGGPTRPDAEEEREATLDDVELAGQVHRLTLEERIEAARRDPRVPRSVLAAIDRNATALSSQSKAKYAEFADTLLSIPWGVVRPIEVGPREFAAGLDASHFGLERPKELVTDFFSNLIWRYRSFDPQRVERWQRSGSAFLFVGPPGVGKTSLAISIASNLGIPYHKVSLGGMRDESDLRGHGFTYEGSKPGAIVQGLVKMGVMNGMFILDEADKTESFAIATLLEILDPEQNHLFHDRYTQTTVDIDLSNCHFVLTANTLDTVPAPVLDRCQVVRLDRYSVEEKIAIARRHLLPRIRDQHALPESLIPFEEGHEDEHVRYLIRGYTHEAGVRQLALTLRTLLLRVHRRDVVDASQPRVEITHDLIKRRVEEPWRPRTVNDDDRVGEALGLGVDVERGVGEVIPIQATRIPRGPGDERPESSISMVHATGNIEKVMDESRRVATTGILTNAEALGIDPQSLGDPVHLHFMGASSRKDGPSAGAAIALALTSLFTGREIRRDVAVTGEIDTRGRITGVGGIDVKLETAVEAGCRTMLLPVENLEGPGGVSRFPEALRRELQILSFAEWRSPRPAFDPEKHVIQVVGVGHVLEAAEVAFIEPRELVAVDDRFVAEAQRLAARRRESSTPPRCPMVVLVKDADEVGERMFRPTLCGRCEGCRLLVPTTAAADVEAATTGATVSTRSTLYDPGRDRLEQILPRLPEVSGATPASPAAVVAPFFSLKALAGGADRVLLANNYTSQGLKLKRVRRILDAVYCRLLHLGPGAIEDCAFLAMRDGIAVLDLGMIPEKYRLDPERAERILERGLGLWLETLDDALGERRAS